MVHEQDDRWFQVLAGNALAPGMVPFAARYGGHQFGHWAGQLGDGRAITLGECVARDVIGVDQQRERGQISVHLYRKGITFFAREPESAGSPAHDD